MKIFLKNIFWAMSLLAFSKMASAGVISDAPRVSTILLKFLNFLLYISGGIAIIALIFSGIMYTLSSGDERSVEKAKNASKYSAFGLFVVLLSLAIVKTITAIIGE